MPTSNRTSVGLLIATFAVLASLAVAGVSAKPAGAAVANPDLQAQCGLSVLLILDESGSIADQDGGTASVRNAAGTFVTALADTGSQVGVMEFNTRARFPIGFTTVTSANLSTFTDYINDQPAAGEDYDPSEYSTADRWTNWDDALLLAQGTGTAADLVVFITDGSPTARNNNHPPPEDNSGVTTGFSEEAAGLANAVEHADAIKTAGVHIFGVGVVGEAGLNTANLQAVSGTDAYDGSNLSTADYTTTNFTGLQAALQDIATELCESSLTVTKYVGEGAEPNYVVAPGWDFTGTVTPSSGAGQFKWVQPAPEAPADPRTVTTDGAGTATFQWELTNATATSSISITETAQPPYVFVRAECKVNGVDQPVDTTLPIELSGLAVEDAVTCSVFNHRNVGTTPVRVRTFTATRNGAAVTLAWRTASEVDVLGYNVWRYGKVGLRKVNPKLVAAKALRSYRVIDRTAKKAAASSYRLQVVSIDGSRSWAGSARLSR